MKTLDGSKDVGGTKALKAHETIIEHLKLNDFEVLDSGWNFNFDKKSTEAFVIVKKDISSEITQEGPPIGSTKDYQKFTDKHQKLGHKTFIKGDRIYTIIPRPYTTAEKFLKDFCNKDFITRRVKGITIRQK